MKKLLIHTCCAPCFSYIQDDISKNGMPYKDSRLQVDMTSLWYNPNIQPEIEYQKRKQTLIDFCKMKDCKLVVIDEYNLKDFVKDVVQNVGENKKYSIRCEYCYTKRLQKTFEYAKQNNFDIVSTTLTISPYQNHPLIQKVANALSKQYGIEFVYMDYRKHFWEGQHLAKSLGLYRQKYCGCVFSIDEGKWEYIKNV